MGNSPQRSGQLATRRFGRLFGRGAGQQRTPAQPTQALVLARPAPQGGQAPTTGAISERELRRAAQGDARYEGSGAIAYAAHAAVDQAAIARSAARVGLPPRTVEIEARLNMASIKSVPDTQISERTRSALIASAARGEDTYAYPPISREGPRNTPWNMWVRGQRARIEDFEEATGGVIESNPQRRLPPGQ